MRIRRTVAASNDAFVTTSLCAGPLRDEPFLHLAGQRRDDCDAGRVAAKAPEPSPSGFPATFSLAALDGTNGYRIDGIVGRNASSTIVENLGDVNGDGYDDIILAYNPFSSNRSDSYVVFGKAGGYPAVLNLAAIDGSNGLRLTGQRADVSIVPAPAAGDVNGDGVADLLLRSWSNLDTYVVFGSTAGFTATVDVADVDGTNGFRIVSPEGYPGSIEVSGAGDVNADGYDDLLIGGGNLTYVVFGKAAGFDRVLDLAQLDARSGFRLQGPPGAGAWVSAAGDVNGDGIGDMLIGSPYESTERPEAGAVYVVFGRTDGFATTVDLTALDGSDGFRIPGARGRHQLGESIASAGDVNGDGYGDVILGAYDATVDDRYRVGLGYVVFGGPDGHGGAFDLRSLDGRNGFRITGFAADDHGGYSVSSAGDVNGDGYDDVLVGAYGGDPNGVFGAGETFVIFGRAGGHGGVIDVTSLDGTNGFRIDGVNVSSLTGYSVSSAGDVNADGFDDILVGSLGFSPATSTYIIFGHGPDEAVTRIGSAAAQTIRGGEFGDVLEGRGGADTLIGGGGRDRLTGGTGGDLFVLAGPVAADADTILDFGRGRDRIGIEGADFGLNEGRLRADRFVTGPAAIDADDRLIYDGATGRLFFDADGSGGQAQVLVATLDGAPVLTAADIVVL